MIDMRLAIRKEEKMKSDKGRCGEIKVGDVEIGVLYRRKEKKKDRKEVMKRQ